MLARLRALRPPASVSRIAVGAASQRFGHTCCGSDDLRRSMSTGATSLDDAGPELKSGDGSPPIAKTLRSPESVQVNKDIDGLLDQNRAWAEENSEWFDHFGHLPNKPKYLWIGCSDARVPANQIIDCPAGSVFVHRNIANLVVSTDANLHSVLQYAVNVLKVPHIIVCGHYDCGGIAAAMSQTHHDSRALGSPLEDWLRNIRDVCRLHEDELAAIDDPDAKRRRLVELNVIEQCINVFKTGVVQRRRHVTSGNHADHAFAQPRIHGVVYSPRDGKLKLLKNDFKNEINKLGKHYDLYTGP